MTLHEAVIQVHIELGRSREDAELRAKSSDGIIPTGAALSQSPLKPGQEREFIEALKLFFRKLDATPGALQALQAEIAKEARKN